jgi:hypothetical protein
MLSDLIRCDANAEVETQPAAPLAVAPPKPPRPTERMVRGRFSGVSVDPLTKQRREHDEVNALVARGAAASENLFTPVTPGGTRAEGRQIARPAALDRAALSPADADRLRGIVKGQRNGQRGSMEHRS